MRLLYNTIIITIAILVSAGGGLLTVCAQDQQAPESTILKAVHNEEAETISILRENTSDTLLVQNAQEQIRPFIHPIVAPDGDGVLTEYRPGHHTHQTGLYWGLKRVNERDFFAECCKPGTVGYYQKVSADVIRETGEEVKWQTVYDLLNEEGNTILTETHTWSMREEGDKYLIDLVWQGNAKRDVTIGEFFVGGLFLRMLWYEGINGEVVNASGQSNQEAEHQRSIWNDVGIQVNGRDDLAHIAMFDHPDNSGFPIPWRVDHQLGVGPSRQIMGDWSLDERQTEVIRYRVVVYTGELDPVNLTRLWTEFAAKYEN